MARYRGGTERGAGDRRTGSWDTEEDRRGRANTGPPWEQPVWDEPADRALRRSRPGYGAYPPVYPEDAQDDYDEPGSHRDHHAVGSYRDAGGPYSDDDTHYRGRSGYDDERGYRPGDEDEENHLSRRGRGFRKAGPGYPEDSRGHREKPRSHREESRSRRGGDHDDDEYGYGEDDYGEEDYADGEEDWYADPDAERDWQDEDEEDYDDDDDFLPGMGGGARRGGRAARGHGRGDRPARARKRGMRRVAPWLAVAVLVVLLGVGGGGFWYVWRTYLHPPDYSGRGYGSVVVHILPGDSAAAIGQILQQAGVVETARAFSNAAKASPKGSSLEPGYYRLRKHMQASLAFALLLSPAAIDQIKVTIPEGWRLTEIIAALGKATGKLSGYQSAVKNVPALSLPSYAKGPHLPEGYLFPATYTITPGMSPESVLQQMAQRFKQAAATVNLVKGAAHDHLTPAQIIVIASIVQAEGRRLSDFPKIAQVIYNRWNQGMPLQDDSTVMYALGNYGIAATPQELRAARKSPYDTYTHYGLPPGPIDSPGQVAIEAALHPDTKGNWLYFVTVDPKIGLTKFTNSYTQFSQWEAQFRANYGQG